MKATILALDTSTENCSVALMVGDNLISRSEIAPREHTAKILPMVDELLQQAGITLDDVDALAFGRGPGSFTGVRIGIGIAQGLAFGASLPMIGISTLAAMAQGAYREHGSTYAACAIDARMSEVYWGRFVRQDSGEWREFEPECVVAPSQLIETVDVDSHPWSFTGTGWQAYQQDLAALEIKGQQTDVLYPEAEDIAFLAQLEFAKGNTTSAEEASPVYLRDKVTWKKLPGRE
ncbi:tRNA (adenosine(37)-N6)-threonylcarbamoyltransferase complex dimerization subunit type 1 TsaB [Vibrio sp. TH_r3]|uniref:tRNA (adenosine(37)-N6)-threonylcarbamoyltransferase complex dimerization subunit type 1 TsaB n=1 Tax=Vibrio sp. TH_r3 TaxID=3082084 RepID=UPI002952A1B0|nr:tRNA (adenosine(37)-N6)-threonylcarbamoyltransferase complex dimerization subunit type 1 TsaB [Vibrio sp. TH_r3]MDV7104032.1 tRNA (adenosine(37)-N6)-threonylcarbamoyltransferase complex dimerization subunit type 1 TsaB [Vibrio sp. TH_r3]